MKRIASVLAMSALLTACGDPGTIPTGIVGVYALQTVNGAALPAYVPMTPVPGSDPIAVYPAYIILADTLRLNADLTYRETYVEQRDLIRYTTERTGVYTQSDAQMMFSINGSAVVVTRTMDGTAMADTVNGQAFIFQKL